MSAQLSSAQLSTAAIQRLSCNSSTQLSGQLILVGRPVVCPHLDSVHTAVLCQLNSHALAQLQSFSSLPLQLLAAQIILLGSRCRTKARCIPRRSFTIVSSEWHMLQLMLAKVAQGGCDRDRRMRPYIMFTRNRVSRCSTPVVVAVPSATVTKRVGCCACRTAHISISMTMTLSNRF